jgi:long-chain acyl-CoA synthetase
VRRRFIAEKYVTVVEAFYQGADVVELATEITYEDGRKGRLEGRMAIETIAGAAPPSARAPAYA